MSSRATLAFDYIVSGPQMSISVSWPTERLATDDYLLTVTGVTPAGAREDIADYYFRVTRVGT